MEQWSPPIAGRGVGKGPKPCQAFHLIRAPRRRCGSIRAVARVRPASPGRSQPDTMPDSAFSPTLELFLLAIPVACVSWTVTHEKMFLEPREWCARRSVACRGFLWRKFFYLFTCEYCFSHWVTIGFLIMTGFKLMYDDFRGYIISFFSLVFVANAYLNLYSRLRVDITSEKKEIEAKEKAIEKMETEIRSTSAAAEATGSDGHHRDG